MDVYSRKISEHVFDCFFYFPISRSLIGSACPLLLLNPPIKAFLLLWHQANVST